MAGNVPALACLRRSSGDRGADGAGLPCGRARSRYLVHNVTAAFLAISRRSRGVRHRAILS